LGDPVISLAQVAEFDQPVDLAWRAGDQTIFIVGQAGTITPLRDGQPGEPVLDITDLTDADGEQGLLGLTFAADGTMAYIDHTTNDGDTVIAEYAVGADGVFEAASRRELLTIDQPYPNHNGGNVTIGPDAMLYIGMGDGGSGGDPQRRALNMGSLLGKIVRIDPTPSGGEPYTVPADNPFVGVAGAQPEIWAVGVRNPWRMSFDPATGDLWFGDVGQGEIEEIDVAWATDGAGRGMNFGWSAFEGSTRYNDDQPADGATPPIFEYPHGDAGCSVSGGAVYRGTGNPALVGWYVFGDYCSGNLYALRTQDRALAAVLPMGNVPALTGVRAGPDGELYALSLDGPLFQLQPG
jgi:glucose/arabinose dehydrogenase